jgi:REP element-mobilizing transposase RayT
MNDAADIPLPRRKNVRMQGWDFTSPGWYFLTLCTQNMRSVFGTIVNGRMVLNDAGRHADAFWREIPAHFPRAVVDEYVVMPNHVHGLLQLVDRDTACRGRLEAFGKPVAGSVPTIVRSYKAAVSRALGEGVWQSRFYEVRARDEAARANIRRYIRANPENYEVVASGVEPASLGNQALLSGPKLGFLASRGAATPHGSLPLKPGEAIMSGFLSPMEQAVFRAGLAHKRPMIWVKPWGLYTDLYTDTACRVPIKDGACRGPIEGAIAAGRLLILSPFEAAVEAPSARRAAWCNLYTLAHCDRLAIGHLKPDGMLACLLSEADPEKEIIYL